MRSLNNRVEKIEEKVLPSQKQPYSVESKVLRQHFGCKEHEELIVIPSGVDFEKEVLPEIRKKLRSTRGRRTETNLKQYTLNTYYF